MVADLTIEGTLGLAGGNLDAGSSTVTIGPAGCGRARDRLGHRTAPEAGAPSARAVAVTFEVGDATAYAPADVVFDTVVIARSPDRIDDARRPSVARDAPRSTRR